MPSNSEVKGVVSPLSKKGETKGRRRVWILHAEVSPFFFVFPWFLLTVGNLYARATPNVQLVYVLYFVSSHCLSCLLSLHLFSFTENARAGFLSLHSTVISFLLYDPLSFHVS